MTTIEGLEDDPVVVALRRSFSADTVVTARDCIVRFPDADETQIRVELSGNLCRCAGYVGIVRAVLRTMNAVRAGEVVVPARQQGSLGPVGARPLGTPGSNV